MTDRRMNANTIEAHTVQLKRLVVKLGGYPEDERAASALSCLESAILALGGVEDTLDMLDRLVSTLVEQPTDADGNPLPPPSPMELPEK